MPAEKRSAPGLLELVLQVQGELRRTLSLIGVTPLQAGVLCYLSEHADARLIDAAEAFRVESPTIVDVVQDLVRKGWVINKRSIKDRRTLCLKLSRKGEPLVRKITPRGQSVKVMLSEQDGLRLG